MVKDAEGTPCSVNAAWNPPDPVFLLVSDQPLTCSQPMPSSLTLMIGPNIPSPPPPAVSPTWELCWALSSSSLVVGTLDLPLPDVNHNAEQAWATFHGQGYAMIMNEATLQITAVDPPSIEFQLEGTGFLISSDTALDDLIGLTGAYTAVRCP
jgi:hypothetical protein